MFSHVSASRSSRREGRKGGGREEGHRPLLLLPPRLLPAGPSLALSAQEDGRELGARRAAAGRAGLRASRRSSTRASCRRRARRRRSRRCGPRAARRGTPRGVGAASTSPRVRARVMTITADDARSCTPLEAAEHDEAAVVRDARRAKRFAGMSARSRHALPSRPAACACSRARPRRAAGSRARAERARRGEVRAVRERRQRRPRVGDGAVRSTDMRWPSGPRPPATTIELPITAATAPSRGSRSSPTRPRPRAGCTPRPCRARARRRSRR